MSTTSRPRRIGRLIAHTTLATATTLSMLAIVSVATAPSAAAAVVPPIVGSEDGNHVTADALPTVQIDGVVWDQVVVGNTVYVVGDFDNARPAGAAPGVNQTPRANMLAYNLTTGALIPGFVANLNNQAKTVTASPDGSRIYIGGLFTTVNGASAPPDRRPQPHHRREDRRVQRGHLVPRERHQPPRTPRSTPAARSARPRTRTGRGWRPSRRPTVPCSPGRRAPTPPSRRSS